MTEANEALKVLDGIEENDKAKFAKAWYSNKGTKSFGFVKDYSEKIIAGKTISQQVQENYFIRTCGALFKLLLD